VLTLAAVVMLSTGCDSRSRRASARLRTENAALQQQLEAMSARTRELEIGLRAAEASAGEMPGTRVAAPRVTAIAVSPMSGFEPGASPDSTVLEVHVTAMDGRQRPVQLVGPLRAQVLRPIPDQPPSVLAEVVLDPETVRDAWRGSLFGATYLIPIDLETNALPTSTPLLVHVFHEDLTTGTRLEATGGVAHQPSTSQP
jgi:hypothetical protein